MMLLRQTFHLASSYVVAQPDHAVRILFDRTQKQREVTMARGDEGDAFADEDGDDVNVELVDLAGIEEGGDDLATAHHPDVFSGLFPQPPDEAFDRFSDELNAGGDFLGRLA